MVQSRLLRSFAIAALLALGASQLASLAHAVVAAHVTCVEHGEAVEAGSAGAAEPAEPGRAGLEASNDGAPHGHDHCWLGLLAQPRAVSAGRLRVPVPPTDAQPIASVTATSPRAARIAIWRIAPKSSPPAAV